MPSNTREVTARDLTPGDVIPSVKGGLYVVRAIEHGKHRIVARVTLGEEQHVVTYGYDRNLEVMANG